MADISAIKLPDNSIYDIKSKKMFYAECSTARNAAAKVVDCDGFVLETGAVIAVRFTDTGTANPSSGNITLNINGTGAKNIVPKGNNSIYTYGWGWAFCNNQTWLFMYNGTYFVHINQDNNTTYSPMSLGFGYATCSTAAATAAKEASLTSYSLVKNGMVSVKFTYAVPANATLNITSKGAKNIFYRGAKITAGVINAGDIATFVYDGTQYQLISVDADFARKTDLPAIDSALSSTSTNPVQNKIINSALSGKAAASHTHTVSQISDFPSSLPANGGNADTVDGVHASDLIRKISAIPLSDDYTSFMLITDENSARVYQEYVRKKADSSGIEKFWRLYTSDAAKYCDLRAAVDSSGVTWNFTGTGSTAVQVGGKRVLVEGDATSVTSETGIINALSNGTAQPVSLSFNPVAVLFFDSTYNHIVNSGFSLSLGTKKFTITPASVSAMGTTSLRFVAFGG